MGPPAGDATVDEEGNSWTTADPHHIPGYAGFLPKLSQTLGKTYGTITHELLVNSLTADDGGVQRRDTDSLALNSRRELTESAKEKWLLKRDRKFSLSLVPGYAGFVPKERENIGLTYSESCAVANANFEGDYVRVSRARAEMMNNQPDDGKSQPKRKRSGYLPEISATWSKLRESSIADCKTTDLFTRSGEGKLASFNVGYSGFVPHLRNQFGQSFDKALGSALEDFNAEREAAREKLNLPVIVNHTARATSPPPEKRVRVYPTTSGAIPHYQGHIPGNKYSFGKTFERATFEALKNAPALSRATLL